MHTREPTQKEEEFINKAVVQLFLFIKNELITSNNEIPFDTLCMNVICKSLVVLISQTVKEESHEKTIELLKKGLLINLKNMKKKDS